MAKKVLVIDDEQNLVKVIRIRLEANGFEVVTASNGIEGLEQWRKEKPDLILLDVMMPQMDGYTFVQESKTAEDLDPVPIIMVTAKAELRDIFKVEGVRDYITKPFDKDELLKKVLEHINS